MSFAFVLFLRESASTVHVLGYFCSHVRVFRFSYEADPTVDGRWDHNHELGYLHLRTILSFTSARLVFIPHQLSKKGTTTPVNAPPEREPTP